MACAVALCAIVAAIHILRQRPTFTATTELLVDPNDLATARIDAAGGATRPYPSSLDSQAYVMQSRQVLDRIAAELDLRKDPVFAPPQGSSRDTSDGEAQIAERLKAHLAIERVGRSSVFRITTSHPDGKRAEKIADTAAVIYLRQLKEAREEAARRIAGTLTEKAEQLREGVRRTELAVETFKAENGLISADQVGLLADQQLASLNQQLLDARNTEEKQRTIYEQARNLTLDLLEQGTIPEVLESGAIARLRERYETLREKQSELAVHLGPDHPRMRAIDTQMANIRQTMTMELDRLRQSLRSSYQRATANTRTLAEKLETLTRASVDNGTARSRLRQLETEAEAARSLYKEAASRAEEYARQQSLATLNSRILTSAAPVEGYAPVGLLPLLGAILLGGFVIGSCLTWLGGLFSARRLSEEALMKRSGFPVLARIPSGLGRTRKSPGLAQLLGFRRSGRKVPVEVSGDGVSDVAKRLQAAMPGGHRGTIVFYSVGDVDHASGVAADIVQALVDAGHDILYAPGALKPKATRFNSTARLGLTGLADAGTEGSAPFADLLKYEHLAAIGTTAPLAGRSRRFSNHGDIAHPSNADIVAINACGTPAAKYLPQLVQKADAILLFMEIGRTNAPDIDDLLERLGYSRDIVLGIVLVEAG